METDDVPGTQPGPITPSYYAIIPAYIRYHPELPPSAKLMYGEITALQTATGVCTASNAYFAKLYDVHPNTISRWIADLQALGAIDMQMIERPGTRSILRREMWTRDVPTILGVPTKTVVPPTIENVGGPTNKNVGDNNTRFNNLSSPPLDENFVNQDFGARSEEMIFWLKGKKKLKHMPPQGWFELFAELQVNGIPLDEFQQFYEWVEDLDWVTGVINEKLLRSQVEPYLRRHELAEKKKKQKVDGGSNGRGKRVHPAVLLRRLSRGDAADNN